MVDVGKKCPSPSSDLGGVSLWEMAFPLRCGRAWGVHAAPAPRLTSASVVCSWNIWPSPSTCRTQILQVNSVEARLCLSRVKVQWRALWLPLHM